MYRFFVLGFLISFSAIVIPNESLAKRHFVFPEMGLGYGHAFFSQNASQPVGQLDFQVGTEWDWGGRRAAAGWLLNLKYATSATQKPPKELHLFHIAPMVSLSSGYGWWTAFARISAGPQLSIIRRDDVTAVGGGLAFDGSIGVKNAVELYSQTTFSVDPVGPSCTFMAGFRVNIIVFMGTLDFLSRISEYEEPPPRYKPNRHRRKHYASPVKR